MGHKQWRNVNDKKDMLEERSTFGSLYSVYEQMQKHLKFY